MIQNDISAWLGIRRQENGRSTMPTGPTIPAGEVLAPQSLIRSAEQGMTDKLADATADLSAFALIVILRLRNMTAIDASGLHALETLSDRLKKSGRTLILCGARHQPAQFLHQAELIQHVGAHNIVPHVQAALARAQEIHSRFSGGRRRRTRPRNGVALAKTQRHDCNGRSQSCQTTFLFSTSRPGTRRDSHARSPFHRRPHSGHDVHKRQSRELRPTLSQSSFQSPSLMAPERSTISTGA